MQSKKRAQLKKWLPAILLAVALHAVVFVLFLNNQKAANNASDNSNSTATSAPINIELSESEKTLTETQMTGLSTDEDSDSASTDVSEDSKKEDVAEQDSEDSSSEKAMAAKEATQRQKELQQQKTENKARGSAQDIRLTANERQAENTNSPLADGAPINDNARYENTPNTSANGNARNPNDRLLLTRDIPRSQAAGLNEDKQYHDSAKEIEEINEKLSATINRVKEQKMQEIHARQEKEKAALLKDKQSQSNERVSQQVAAVSEQLAIDEAAEAEFSNFSNKKSAP